MPKLKMYVCFVYLLVWITNQIASIKSVKENLRG